MKYFFHTLFLTFLALPVNMLAQNKYEREYRIDVAKVPSEAKEFVRNFEEKAKAKWYAEESQNGKSIEAKVRFRSKLHSIEFDTLGSLQDLEVEIEEKELGKALRNSINEALRSEFRNYKIRKVQIQYSGEAGSVLEKALKETSENTVNINYELVVKGKNEEGVQLYEITFDQSVKLLQKSLIVFRNSDHLEY